MVNIRGLGKRFGADSEDCQTWLWFGFLMAVASVNCKPMNLLPRTGLLALLAAVFFLSAGPVSQVKAQASDATFDSAVFQLRQSLRPSRDGSHNMMLRSLRQMADTQMTPLFSEMVNSDFPVLKIHGMLGLAEIAKPKQLDLVRLAAVEDPAVQAQLVSAALDSKLLTLEQCQQLVDWPGLDMAVKVLVSAPLLKAGRLSKTQPLEDAALSPNLARKSMANLMLMQLGNARAGDELDKLSQSEESTRDQVRAMLLSTAVEYEFDRIGPWAMKVATEPKVHSQLGLMALSVALRFNTPGCTSIWQQHFASTSDIAQRTRLALMALRVSQWSSPDLFVPLVSDKDTLLVNIGKAGKAVASGKDITPAVVGLIEQHHPMANAWALGYASSDDASEQDAKMILLAVVLAYEQGPIRGRPQRLDDAVSAVHRLIERSPDDAITLLRPILVEPKTRRELAQGILLGLLRADSPRAHEVVAGLPAFDDINTRNLVIVLLAKQDQLLSATQLEDLGLCVRGGGLGMAAVRIQASWSWLKRTGQIDKAISQALKP